MKMELVGPISQAVATFAGALFVLIGIWYRERLEHSNRAKSARIQIAAEVRALLDLIELNGYLAATRGLIDKLRAGTFTYLNFHSNRSVISVYEANLQNLGHLEDAASDVVRFYMIILSALEDKDSIVEIGRGFDSRRAKGEELTPYDFAQLVRRHEMFHAKLAESVRLGEKICQELHYRGKKKIRLAAPTPATSPALAPVAVPSEARPS
jgi:hypothetical protein